MDKNLKQTECLKDSGKNSTTTKRQIPFLNISQRPEWASRYFKIGSFHHVSMLVIL
jgi:hypothetical protein